MLIRADALKTPCEIRCRPGKKLPRGLVHYGRIPDLPVHVPGSRNDSHRKTEAGTLYPADTKTELREIVLRSRGSTDRLFAGEPEGVEPGKDTVGILPGDHSCGNGLHFLY